MSLKAKPTAAEVIAAREAAGLTPEQCADIVGVDTRTWQKWEYDERKMPYAAFELFKLVTDQNPERKVIARRKKAA